MLWDLAQSDRPHNLGMSADGELVFGHVQRFKATPFPTFYDEARIWTRGSAESVTFEVFLRSMGLDTSNWTIGEILDVSDDGKTFLAYGSESGGNGYQLLIVIPEPGVALLMGLGLVGLTRVRTRDRRD